MENMNDDDEIKEDEVEESDLETDIDDELIPGKKKPKAKEDEALSLDDLSEEEDEALPEDSFDDVDLW